MPSLADATAVPGLSANATSAGAETSWSTDHIGLRENAAAGQGEGSGSSRLCTPKSLRQSKFKSTDCPIVGAGGLMASTTNVWFTSNIANAYVVKQLNDYLNSP